MTAPGARRTDSAETPIHRVQRRSVGQGLAAPAAAAGSVTLSRRAGLQVVGGVVVGAVEVAAQQP